MVSSRCTAASASVHLTRRLRLSLLLTDDLAAREAAAALGLTPVGSLGVVVRGYRLHRASLADAEELIVALHGRSSLFVTRAIADLAIEHLRRGR